MRTETDAVAAGKKPRKLTVTVVVGPRTVEQIEILIGAMAKVSPISGHVSVSDVIGWAVNRGLAEMGSVLLGGVGAADGVRHSTPHAEGQVCALGCAGYLMNHYA